MRRRLTACGAVRVVQLFAKYLLMVDSYAASINQVRARWTAIPPLELRGIGTGLVESLASYVGRVIATTGATRSGLARHLGLRSIKQMNRLGAFHAAKDPRLTEAVIDKLQRLTGQDTLRCGTLWALSHILAENSPCHSGKSRRRWCPACYRDWDATSYEPLIWEIDLLSCCPVHGCRLESYCPLCGRAQQYRLAPDERRVCHLCGTTLSKGAVWKGVHPFLQWVDSQIIDLIEICANPHSEPLPHRVFQEFVAGLDKTSRGKSASALRALVKFYACCARLRGRRVSVRSLINLCAIQGVSVKELLAAPRETSGPFLFDKWAGLTYLPLPSARQAQKIYVAKKCLMDFLRQKPAYLPPISLLLRGFGVQLLAIRDVAPEAYDFYEAKYSVQGNPVIQKHFRAAYQCANSVINGSSSGRSQALSYMVARVAARAEVTSVLAKHAVRSASLAQTTQAMVKIQKYEQEMPVEEAVDWFVQNRRCIWRENDS